jgi:hypothetical protein
MTRVVAYVPDLMDRSRLTAQSEVEVTFVADPAALAAAAPGAALVVVDLARPGVLDAVADGIDAPVVGFGSHVEAELLAAARAAGCREVLPRSRFFRELPRLLGTSESG